MAAAAAPTRRFPSRGTSARFAAAISVVPTTFTYPTLRIFVETAGDLVVTMAGDGGDITIPALDGTYHEVEAIAIAAGTDAAGIIAYW